MGPCERCGDYTCEGCGVAHGTMLLCTGCHRARGGAIRQLVNYWERRRIAYNLVLGLEGLLIIFATGYVQHVHPLALLFQIAIYGIIANAFYTLGPYLNILVVIKRDAEARPWRLAFTMGLFGSMVVTFALASLTAFVVP